MVPCPVELKPVSASVQVQSGGSFDVDYTVMGPDGKVVMENSKERQLDSVFTAKATGEYSFCFNNEMSTFAEKMVDFEIAVRGPPLFQCQTHALSSAHSTFMVPRDYAAMSAYQTNTSPRADVSFPPPFQVENESPSALLPSKQGTSPEQTSALEESIMKVSRDLSTINRNQKYFRTRENRNFSTVKSTESRIFNFSVVESGLMVCMAGLQVFIVRFFFQGARKGMLRDVNSCKDQAADKYVGYV